MGKKRVERESIIKQRRKEERTRKRRRGRRREEPNEHSEGALCFHCNQLLPELLGNEHSLSGSCQNFLLPKAIRVNMDTALTLFMVRIFVDLIKA